VDEPGIGRVEDVELQFRAREVHEIRERDERETSRVASHGKHEE